MKLRAFQSLFLILFLGGGIAKSATLTWTNLAGGSWSVAANWIPNQVPANGDDVIITGGGTYSSTNNIGITLDRLTLGGQTGTQTLIANGLSLTNTSIINPNGVFDGNGGTISGSLTVAAGGVLNLSGEDLEGALTVQAGGILSLSNTIFFAQNNYALGYSNTATLTNYGTVIWSGTLYGAGNSPSKIGGGIIVNAGLWKSVDNGTIQTYNVQNTNYFINTGMLVKTGGASTTSINWNFISNGGTVTTESGTFNMGDWIGSGTVYGNANFSGGTLSGIIGSNAVFNWSSGDLESSLTIQTGGTLSLSNTIFFAQNNSALGYTNTAALTNYGTVVWSGTLYGVGNSTSKIGGGLIVNAGLWESVDNGSIQTYNVQNTNYFINTGTLVKTGGTSAASIDWNFSSTGEIDTPSGSLALNWAAPSVLHGNLNLAAGAISSPITVAGTAILNWSSGDLESSLTVLAGGTLNLSNTIYFAQNNSAHGFSNIVTLTNYGTVIWAANLYGAGNSTSKAGGGIIVNAGLWQSVINSTMDTYNVQNTNYFINTGTLVKTGGTGTSSINWNFINTGGSVTTTSGAFSMGDWIGSGPIYGNANLSGGTLSGTLTAGENINFSGDINDSLIIGSNAVLNWTGGDLEGSLTVQAGGTLSLSNTIYFAQNNSAHGFSNIVTLTNYGTVIWAANLYGAGNSTSRAGGGLIVNAGLWQSVINSTMDTYNVQNTNYFINTGTLMKTGGTGTTSINWNFINTGGTVTTTSGTFSMGDWIGGGTVYGNANFSGGTLNGTLISGAKINFSGEINESLVITSNAILNWSSGDLESSLTVLAGGTLSLSNTIYFAQNNSAHGFSNIVTLTNYGTVIWAANLYGAGNSSSKAGGGIIVNAGLWQSVINSTMDTYNVQNTNYFINTGTLQRTGGTGTESINWTFNNTGELDLESGTLSFGGTAVQTAGILQLNGGSLSVTQPFQLMGGVLSGTNTISGNIVNSATLDLGATPGTLQINGSYVQTTSGTLNLKIGGVTAGSQYDHLIISGAATFGGDLNVTLIDPFVPSAGNSFGVVSYGSFSGGFANDNGLIFSTNLLFQETYLASSLNLVAAGNTNQSVTRPAIISQPASQTVINGQNVSFFVTATGTHPLAYQWQFNGAAISGATSGSLTLANTKTNETGKYQVVVSNNGGSVTSAVAVLTVQPIADLVVMTVTNPSAADAGEPFVVSWQSLNQGSQTAIAPWADSIAISTNSTGVPQIHLGDFTFHDDLGSGQSINRSETVIAPGGLDGVYYVVVTTDSGNQVQELGNENNNVTVGSTPLRLHSPDLQPGNLLAAPATANFGDSFIFSWNTTNAGSGPAFSSWTDEVYLGPSSNSLVGAIPLASVVITNVPIANGAVVSNSTTISLPLTAQSAAGTYYLLVSTDDGQTVAESNEGNNLASRLINLSLPPLPDLSVQGIMAPPQAQPGQIVSLTWKTTNSGSASANGTWSESVYLATNNTGAGLSRLATFFFTNNLAAGGAVTRNEMVTIPLASPLGNVWFAVSADVYNEIVEQNETNNLGVATMPTAIPAVLSLSLSASETIEGATQPVRGVVTRNGDESQPLTTSISVSDATELASPSFVTIPAGQASASFDLTPLIDGLVRGPQTVIVTASADAFTSASASVIVQDADMVHLSLTLATNTVMEGGLISGTVTRNTGASTALTVTINASDSTRISTPALLVLAAGQSSTNFEALAVENSLIENPITNSLTATAPGAASAVTNIVILDDDLPSITMTLGATSVSEGAGAQATTATFTRTPVTSRSVVLQLTSSNPNAAIVPATATIPAGAASISVPVAAVNNDLVDGNKTSTLTAYILASGTSTVVSQAASAVLTVTDDDGPTLKLSLASHLVAQGLNPATSAVVFRNTGTNTALVVSLASSDGAKLAAPASVTIPIGAFSVNFNVASLNGGASGNETVSVTATAAGFNSGSDSLVVSDASLPDLVVSSVIAPASADTETFANLGYTILNQGLSAMSSNVIIQTLYLSTNRSLDGATLVGSYPFAGSLPAGEAFSQTFSIRLPQAAGDYWVIAQTDVSNTVAEILEDNNTSISSVPIHVTPAYEAVVATTVHSAVANTPIPFSGRAFKPISNQPAPFVLVNIHIYLRQTHRIISALTDSQGNFSTTWQPLPGEAGIYTIGAAHPGDADATVQDQFTLYGMTAQPALLTETIFQGGSVTDVVNIVNAGDVPLTALNVTTTNVPPNLMVTATLQTNSLGELATNQLSFTIKATDASYSQAQIGLIVTSAEGATVQVPISVAVQGVVPRLVAMPGQLVSGVTVGDQKLVSFQVVNEGAAESGPISISLPALPWLSLASANPMPSLAPGATNSVTLRLMPPAGTALNTYSGNLGLNAAHASLSVPFQFRALSEAKGDLKVVAVDDLTFYAAGSPPVTNATVILTDATTGAAITNGVTGHDGAFYASQLTEGYYNLQVSAAQHTDYRGTILVLAGQSNEIDAFVSFQSISYTWIVVPTEIPDEYTIAIQTEFEANVPIPVVTVEPTVIDLANMVGDTWQVNLSVSNHGLLAAQDCQLQFDTHPNFKFTPLINNLGTLPANSSMVIPLTIQRLSPPNTTNIITGSGPGMNPGGGNGGDGSGDGGNNSGSSGAPCTASGQLSSSYPCGGEMKSSTAPIVFPNAGNCGTVSGLGAPGGGGGVTGGGGGGGYGFSGGGYGYTSTRGGGGPAGVVTGGLTPASSAPPINYAPPCPTNGSPASSPDCGPLPILKDCLPSLLPDLPNCLHGAYECGEDIGSKNPEGVENCLEAGVDCAGALGHEIPVVGAVLGVVGDLQCLNHLLMCFGPSSPGTLKPLSLLSDPAEAYKSGVRNLFDLFNDLTGAPDGVWVNENSTTNTTVWIERLREAMAPSSDGGAAISDAERAALLTGIVPEELSASELNRVMDRWNRTLTNWSQNIYEPSNAPAGQSTDFISLSAASLHLQLAAQNQALAESGGFSDPLTAYIQTLNYNATAGGRGGVCGSVKLELDQDAVLSREAFKATLQFNNGETTPLAAVLVQLNVVDASGNPATNLFGIPIPQLVNLSAVDGSGTLAAGTNASVMWTVIPTVDAAPTAPVVYYVGGMLQYSLDGTLVSIPLTPVPITVHPVPQLDVDYFLERNVYADDPNTPAIEPSIPFSLAILLRNHGGGTAHDFTITSAQPTIVDNEKGLLIDFKIIASQVDGQNLLPSLMLDLGDIAPGTNVIGRWLMTSTLQGLFTDYDASFEAVDDLGNPKLSLIDNVSIHEMIHVVDAPAPFADGRPDFLVNDLPDPNDYPDTVYLSDGTSNNVQVVLASQVNGTVSAGNLQVQLNAMMPEGFVYLNVPDPANGAYQLVNVTRSDGVPISLDTNVWITDRTFVGLGRPPIYEHVLHLFDYNSTGSYILTYSALPSADTTAPASAVSQLPANSYEQIPVNWSGADDASGSGIAFYDIYVSQNNGPFSAWLTHTSETSAIYQGTYGSAYSFYSIATDASGNRESAPQSPDAQTMVSLTNSPPVILAATNVTVDEGSVVTVLMPASDPDAAQVLTFKLAGAVPPGVTINSATGALRWSTGEADGPGTNVFSVIVTDNGLPALSATGMVTVIVREVNQPPVLAPIANFVVSEGQLVTFTNHATDPDIPTNTLTYSLAGNIPTGVTLDPVTGVFRWTPNSTQGPTTNYFTLTVTDNGVPPLSASQPFNITVRDTLSDFNLNFGSTNLLNGETGTVPIILAASLPLTNITLQLSAPASELTNLVLRPLSPEITQGLLRAAGSNNYDISFDLDPSQQTASVRTIAALDFLTVSNVHSSVAYIVPSQLLASQSGGAAITNGKANQARIIIVGIEPVLDLVKSNQLILTLYGQPGSTYGIFSDTNLQFGLWNQLTNFILTNRFLSLPISTNTVSPIFYRSEKQ